jgi:hypothetical protein
MPGAGSFGSFVELPRASPVMAAVYARSVVRIYDGNGGPHMIRKLAAILSVVIFVLVIAAWVRSYRVYDQIVYAFGRPVDMTCTMYALTSSSGRCRFGWQDGNVVLADGFGHGSGPAFHWTGPPSFWNQIGFGWGSGENLWAQGKHYSYESLLIPYWALAAVFAVVPIWQIALARRRKKQRALAASGISNQSVSRRGSWLDSGFAKQLVTPITVLSCALISGFCAITGILNLAMMAFRLIAPELMMAPITVLLALSTFGLWRLRRRVQRAKAGQSGFCMACGYSLTGNISGICPECGSAADSRIVN